MKTQLLLAIWLLISLSIPAAADDSLKQMFTNASVRGEFKVLSFTRDVANGGYNQDIAVGGMLYYKTSSLNGIRLGVSFATTSPSGENDDKGSYYGIAAPDHDSVSRLQEYYLQYDRFDTQLKIGAQELNTPFLGIHPIRMLNRSYRGLSLVNNSIKNLTFSACYLTDNLGWVDDKFISFNGDVYIGGIAYRVPTESADIKLQAWAFTMVNNLDQTFFKVNLAKQFGDFVLHAAPAFMTQKSKGDESLAEVDTYQYGLKAGVTAFGLDLTGFYARTGDDSLLDRWGQEKIINQQVRNSGDEHAGDRGDEDAYAVRLSYDFAKTGLDGLSADIFYANYDAPTETIYETDFTVQYTFSTILKGLCFRARYAIVEADKQPDLTDTRFYLTYKF